MWFLFGEVFSSSGCMDGLRYSIVALPEPSINYFETAHHYFFECRNCTNQRYDLLRALSFVSVVSLDALLY